MNTHLDNYTLDYIVNKMKNLYIFHDNRWYDIVDFLELNKISAKTLEYDTRLKNIFGSMTIEELHAIIPKFIGNFKDLNDIMFRINTVMNNNSLTKKMNDMDNKINDLADKLNILIDTLTLMDQSKKIL